MFRRFAEFGRKTDGDPESNETPIDQYPESQLRALALESEDPNLRAMASSELARRGKNDKWQGVQNEEAGGVDKDHDYKID